jgi:hypothetical protein
MGRTTAFLAIGLATLTAAGPAVAQGGLVPGAVVNATDRCGAPGSLIVQFLGSDLSPRLELAAGAEARTSLSRGVYSVTVSRSDGTLVEEVLARVEEGGFRLPVGCPGAMGAGDLKSEPVAIRLANTTADCGDARDLDFVVGGGAPVRVAAGAVVEARVPGTGVLFEALAGGRRVWMLHAARVREGRTIFVGCTDPDAMAIRGGETVAFENTTEGCPGGGRHVTLWVDGFPVVGRGPAGKAAVVVPAGRHVFEVYGGMGRERLLRGEKDVKGPFRIRSGCGG